MIRLLTSSLVLWTSALALFGSGVTITRTNWTERWFTNLIEVRMPVNRFVNEYRTNYITQFHTNTVDVYVTNRVTRIATNLVALTVIQTNFVIAFKTNWNMVTVTNPVAVEDLWTNTVVAHQTNRIMRTQTNHVAVNVLQTNFVTCHQTNWSVVNLTNWETVVLFRTNWITQPATNIVQVDTPLSPPASVPTTAQPVAPAASEDPLTPASAAAWTGPLAIAATRTARPPANNLVEIRMKVRWTNNTTAPLQVQHWRVEREDAAILLFGQEQEFERQLPIGKYKVEARLKAGGDNSPVVARGTLSVTAREAVIQPRLLVKK